MVVWTGNVQEEYASVTFTATLGWEAVGEVTVVTDLGYLFIG